MLNWSWELLHEGQETGVDSLPQKWSSGKRGPITMRRKEIEGQAKKILSKGQKMPDLFMVQWFPCQAAVSCCRGIILNREQPATEGISRAGCVWCQHFISRPWWRKGIRGSVLMGSSRQRWDVLSADFFLWCGTWAEHVHLHCIERCVSA